jgi:hypothetical protein
MKASERGESGAEASRLAHLDIAAGVEAVHLVQKLEHGTLDLAFAAGRGVVALGAHGVDLVDEHDGGRMLIRHAEQLAHLATHSHRARVPTPLMTLNPCIALKGVP